MAEENRKSWRELCCAARKAQGFADLLKIVRELNTVLKREEQVRRDFREASRVNHSPEEIRCQ